MLNMPIGPILKITVCGFYTSKEADIAPSASVLVQADGSGEPPDWDRIVRHLVKSVAESIHEAPLTEIRAMTLDEAKVYRDAEDEDEL